MIQIELEKPALATHQPTTNIDQKLCIFLNGISLLIEVPKLVSKFIFGRFITHEEKREEKKGRQIAV
jgi:hypothetical protein